MKELIRVRVQYTSRQQCCKTHKRPLHLPFTVSRCVRRPSTLSLGYHNSMNKVKPTYLPQVVPLCRWKSEKRRDKDLHLYETGDGEKPENGTNVGISKRGRPAGIWFLLSSECLGQCEVQAATCSAFLPQRRAFHRSL